MITIEYYTNKFKQQVVELICKEYGYKKEDYIHFFDAFYNNDFQNKAILIVALDKNKVIGFQSFFYWPYNKNGKLYHSYQSGNSIVDSSYRGKGIFKKLLHFIDDKNLSIDFIIGFPVEASYYSFIKAKWKNPFNLHWYIKINNLFSLFLSPNHGLLKEKFSNSQKANIKIPSNTISISDNDDFITWRNNYYKDEHYYYTYSKDNKVCEIGFKLNIRKKYLKEIIIGQINGNIETINFVSEAIMSFLKEIKKINFISFVSIALNSSNAGYIKMIKQLNFKRGKKQIYFIMNEKSLNFESDDYKDWLILRGDIDTW